MSLVTLGATLFVLLSSMIELDSSPTRIAAQVVSGIGFLAGGVILRDGFSVTGLNTAATSRQSDWRRISYRRTGGSRSHYSRQHHYSLTFLQNRPTYPRRQSNTLESSAHLFVYRRKKFG